MSELRNAYEFRRSNGAIQRRQHHKDHCKYCFSNGKFIDKMTMEEFIEKCSYFGAKAGMTNEEMKEHCTKLFPTLKRWKTE